MAVRLERAHAQRLGQGESVPVMGLSWHDVGGLVLGVDVPQELQGVRLVALFPVGAGEGQGQGRRTKDQR